MLSLPYGEQLRHPSLSEMKVCSWNSVWLWISGQGLLVTTIPPIVVLYSCITNYPKTQQLKTTNIYYCTVSLGQDFGSSLAGWPLAQGFSWGCSLDVHQGSNHLNSQLGLEDLLLAHSKLLAKIQLPRSCWHPAPLLRTCKLAFPRTGDPEREWPRQRPLCLLMT